MLFNRDFDIERCLFASAEFCAARCAVAEHGSALQGNEKAVVSTTAPETRWVPTVGRHAGYLVISTFLVSRRNRPPITTDISAIAIGYHRP